MECLTHSPAFNCIKMAWVAGLGHAALALEVALLAVQQAGAAIVVERVLREVRDAHAPHLGKARSACIRTLLSKTQALLQ